MHHIKGSGVESANIVTNNHNKYHKYTSSSHHSSDIDNNSDSEPLLNSNYSNNIDKMSASRPTEDPFYTIRDEVRSQADQVKVRHERFQDLVKTVDTSSNVEFKELRKGLVKDIRSVDKKVKGLKDAVDMVDKNRSKFPHIKDAELASRKRFVDDTTALLADVKSNMESPSVRRKMEDDENRARRESLEGASNALSGSAALERENDRFIKDQHQQAKTIMKEQDIQLGHLDSAVDRLHQIGRDVKQELDDQNRMLDALDSDLDAAGNKMNVVQASLSKLLNTKDGCQIYLIVVLTLILIILIALVIWT